MEITVARIHAELLRCQTQIRGGRFLEHHASAIVGFGAFWLVDRFSGGIGRGQADQCPVECCIKGPGLRTGAMVSAPFRGGYTTNMFALEFPTRTGVP